MTWPHAIAETILRLFCLAGAFSMGNHLGLPDWATVVLFFPPAFAALEVFRYQVQQQVRGSTANNYVRLPVPSHSPSSAVDEPSSDS